MRGCNLVPLALVIGGLVGPAYAATPGIHKVNGSIVVGGDQASGNVSSVNGSIEVGESRAPGNLSTVNGSVEVASGQSVGDISTVNGSIRVADKDVIGHVHTVNGAIWLGTATRALSLGTVNGRISVGPQSRIMQTVGTVNGAIQLQPSADVSGHVGSVNGGIRLDAAHVGGGIESVSGDIDVAAGSRVEGGILIRNPRGLWGRSCTDRGWSLLKWLSHFGCRPPVVVIGPHSVVTGTLKFERPVKLYVSTSARIGPIDGATAVRYSGARPPAQ